MVRGFLIFCLSTVLLSASACTKANNKSDISKFDTVLPEYKQVFMNSCSNSIIRAGKAKSLMIPEEDIKTICECNFEQIFIGMSPEEQEKNGQYILKTGEPSKEFEQAMDNAAVVCNRKAKEMGIRPKPILE